MRADDKNWEEALQAHGRLRQVAAGEPIDYQGTRKTHIGYVLKGRARASVYSEAGQETWVSTFKAGEFFGAASLLTDIPIDFELVAETDLIFVAIPTAKFDNLLTADTGLSQQLSKGLAKRLNIMTNRLIEAVTLSSPGRVCAELVRLADPVGIDPGKSIIRPNPIFVELALRVSSTRETVSRTISDLQKHGILTREPGALLIHKPQALEARIR